MIGTQFCRGGNLRGESQTVRLSFQLLGQPHVLLRMQQNDVDLGREQASQGDGCTQGDGDAQSGDVDLKESDGHSSSSEPFSYLMTACFVGCEVNGQECQPRIERHLYQRTLC